MHSTAGESGHLNASTGEDGDVVGPGGLGQVYGPGELDQTDRIL